jgi:hypothetical protein
MNKKRSVCLALPITVGLAAVLEFYNVQPGTAAKFITKSSLFILLLGVIRRLELKLISEQKVENIFVAPPYCQCNVVRSFFLSVS